MKKYVRKFFKVKLNSLIVRDKGK